MGKLFKKKNKIKDVDSDLVNRLRRVEEQYKSDVLKDERIEPQNTNCCTGFFACLKDAYDSIPKEYKEIASWLTKLATKQATNGVNEAVLVSAIRATLGYISEKEIGTDAPAELLKLLIDQIVEEVGVDLNLEPDYPALQEYCQENKIKIPSVINTYIESKLNDTVENAVAL